METSPATTRRSAAAAARPSGDTSGMRWRTLIAPRIPPYSPPGLKAGSQRPICSSAPSISSTPKTTSRTPAVTVVALDQRETPAHPIEGQGGEYEGHAQAGRVDEQEAVSYTHLTLPTNREV